MCGTCCNRVPLQLVDVDALRALSLSDTMIPGISSALPGVATRFAGLCTRIYGALGDDIHTLSQALLALEGDEEAEAEEPPITKSLRAPHLPHRRQRRRIGLRVSFLLFRPHPPLSFPPFWNVC